MYEAGTNRVPERFPMSAAAQKTAGPQIRPVVDMPRAASLNRFLQAYRQLAQMPPPILRESTLSPLVTRVAGLETRIEVKVIPGPDVTVMADPDQLEQMLINLVRNAAEAVLEGPREPEQLPSQLFAPANGKLLWLVDTAAAGMLSVGTRE